MRRLSLSLVLVFIALIAVSSADSADKPTPDADAHWAVDGREGGETIADAIEVTLPFQDTGATCDNVDDYDEVCPYSGSTSPDVVYTIVSPYSLPISIDLFGSTYDTKVYVYDADLNLVACNDDYYPDYVSRIEMLDVQGGARYYVVIDGYGGDCGEYVVTTCEILPCATWCLDGDTLEGEPFPDDGVDQYNAGCDVDPPVFQSLQRPDDASTLVFCGESGYHGSFGDWGRDTDWLQMTAAGAEIHVYLEAPYSWPIDCDVLLLDGCDEVSLWPYQLGACDYEDLTIPTVPGQVVTLRLRPTAETPSPCGDLIDQYRLSIDGIEGPVATEVWSWSAVKRRYR